MTVPTKLLEEFERDARVLMKKYNTGIFYIALQPDPLIYGTDEPAIILSDAPGGWLKVICASTIANIRLAEQDLKRRLDEGEEKVKDPTKSIGNQGDIKKEEGDNTVKFPTPD